MAAIIGLDEDEIYQSMLNEVSNIGWWRASQILIVQGQIVISG